MRRRGLRRRTPLKATRFGPEPNGLGPELKRSRLAPVSAKKRVQLAEERAAVAEHGAAFRAAIRGERCVVCGRSEAQAYEETGFGHEAHHAIRQEVLRRLGMQELLWVPGNAVATCEEPCHRRHTQRQRRILRAELPERVFKFCSSRPALLLAFEAEYPR